MKEFMYQTPSVESDIEWFSTREEAEQFCKDLSIECGLCNIREVDEEGNWVWGVGYKNGDRTKYFNGGMRAMKIAVLDYYNGRVDFVDGPDDLKYAEDVEDFLSAEYGYHTEMIHYMTNVKEPAQLRLTADEANRLFCLLRLNEESDDQGVAKRVADFLADSYKEITINK